MTGAKLKLGYKTCVHRYDAQKRTTGSEAREINPESQNVRRFNSNPKNNALNMKTFESTRDSKIETNLKFELFIMFYLQRSGWEGK